MKRARLIFLIIGLIILVILLKFFGIKETLDKILEIGWNFWIIVGIFFFTNNLLTLAWWVLIPYSIKGSYFFKFTLARLAGDSTSSLNALGAVAGEPLKAMYIRDIIPMKVGLASVVLDRTIKTVSSILISLTGIFVSLFILDIPIYITIITITGGICALLFMLLVLKKQKDGFGEFIISKIPVKLADRFLSDERREKIKTLDDEIKFIFSSSENLRHFYISLGLHYFTIIISCSLEIYLFALFLNIPGSPDIFDAFFIYIFGFILTSAVFFMPANVGTSEGSYSLALGMLGFEPAYGLTIGILRRFRTFFWAGIGILLLFYSGLMKKD